MDSADYATNMMLIRLLVGRLMHCPLAQILKCAELASTLGPVLSPTLWKQNGKLLAEEIVVLRALEALQRNLPARPVIPCPAVMERLGDARFGVGVIVMAARNTAEASMTK